MPCWGYSWVSLVEFKVFPEILQTTFTECLLAYACISTDNWFELFLFYPQMLTHSFNNYLIISRTLCSRKWTKQAKFLTPGRCLPLLSTSDILRYGTLGTYGTALLSGFPGWYQLTTFTQAFFFFFFWQYWRLNSGPCACEAVALPRQLHPHSFLLIFQTASHILA
jgi:hypothetical protein